MNRLASEAGSFLCIEPVSAMDGITYMQAAFIQKTQGIFKKKVISSYYQVEVQEEKPNGDLYQYFLETEDFHNVLKIICDFYESRTIPKLAQWRHELFYQA